MFKLCRSAGAEIRNDNEIL